MSVLNNKRFILLKDAEAEFQVKPEPMEYEEKPKIPIPESQTGHEIRSPRAPSVAPLQTPGGTQWDVDWGRFNV